MWFLITTRQFLINTLLLCCVWACESPFSSKGKYCVFQTEPRTFNEGCDVRGFDAFDINLYRNNDIFVWLPIKSRYRYGPKVYQIPGCLFSEIFENKNFDEMKTSKEDCAVIKGNVMNYVDCSEKHPHLCIYDNSKHTDMCDNSILDIKKCLWSYHNNTDEDELKINGDVYITDSEMSFSRLPDPGGVNVSYVQLSSDCAKCKINGDDIPKADLVLNFEVQARKLFLTVYSPEGIFKNVDQTSIYCYTDASEEIEELVDINFVIGVFSNTSQNREVYELDLEEYIGNYWCEAFQLPSLRLIKSNKVFAFKREGSELALMFRYESIDDHSFCKDNTFDDFGDYVLDYIKKHCGGYLRKFRLMEIVHMLIFTSCKIDFIAHLTGQEYVSFFNCQTFESHELQIINVTNALYCEKETGNLSWPKTYIGETATSLEICIDENKIPIRRACGGDFIYGAQWLEPQGSCSDTSALPPHTLKLHNITLKSMQRDLSREVALLSNNTRISNILDVEYFSNALNKMFALRQNSSEYIYDAVEVIDNLMEGDSEVLKDSQSLLNSTDNILHISEAIYGDTQILGNATFMRIQKKNHLVLVTKPLLSNFSGIAIYGKNTTNIRVAYINRTETAPKFTDDLILATILPNEAFINISQNASLIITIFFKEKLFVDTKSYSKASNEIIVSIVVPGYGVYLLKPVKVWFASNVAKEGSCSFWDYGDMFHKKSGSWSGIGGSFVRTIGSVVECEYSHLTPFAFLVMMEKITPSNSSNDTHFEIYVDHYFYLNTITIIGTFLSIFGISIIFLTALLFPECRAVVGTKILMQLSLVIFLEIILAQIADKRNVKDSTACTAVGIILHYIVCSKFCWMLVFAGLQYSRFVSVLSTRPTHLVLKAGLIGWLLPLIPVIIAVSFSLQSYSAGTFMFCYPKGLTLILCLLLPVTLIVCCNLLTFIFIMYKIASTTNRNRIKMRQVTLAVLLFFMLGIPWLFGLLIELFEGTWLHYFCAYMFCITATLQGFVLFVFYILLNSEVRWKWRRVLYRNQSNERLDLSVH